MKLKIERVEIFGVAMPLAGTFTSAGVSKQATKAVVIRLTASDGTLGISSAEQSSVAKPPHTAADLAVAIRERIAPALIGQDPTNINRLAELFDRLTPTQPGAGAAVEMACVELASRAMGVPLHTYLGGAARSASNSTAGSGSFLPRRRPRKRSGGSRRGSARRRSKSAAVSKRTPIGSARCAMPSAAR
jgi:L-alanine-DL-glutamate epimerase-like enolase superfamily enzyme